MVHGISPEEEELNQKDLGLIKNWRLLTESARTELLTRLLDRYNWNQAALAAVCDIGTNTLYRWMHVLGIKNKRTGATKNISPETIAAEKTLVALEKKRIIEALENSSWIQKDAAKKLGISSRSLHYKLDVLKIDHPRWRKRR